MDSEFRIRYLSIVSKYRIASRNSVSVSVGTGVEQRCKHINGSES